MYTCGCVCVYIYMYTCTYIYTCICIYIYIYTYVNKYINLLLYTMIAHNYYCYSITVTTSCHVYLL